MESMEGIIKQVKPTLSQSSIKNYTTNINKLYKSFNTDTKNITNLKWIYNRKKITEFINSLKTPNTKKTYISNILTLLNYDKTNPKFKTELQYYIDLSKDNQENIKLSLKTDNKKQTDKIIDMNTYDKLLSTIKQDKKLDMEYLQFLMLKYLPIRNELSTLIYITNEDFKKLNNMTKISHNWIIKLSKFYRVIRHHYKTNSKYGMIKTDIKQKDLKKVLNEYVKSNNIQSNSPLFIYKDKQQTPNDLSQRLSYISNKIINVKLSTSSIFKIVLCNVMKQYTDPNTQKQLIKEYGSIRGTEYDTLINYYVFNKNCNISSNED